MFIAAALAAAFLRSPLHAEQPAPSAAKIVVAARSLADAIDPAFLGIIELAASLRLERRGFACVVLGREGATALNDPVTVLGGAEALGARYLLLAEASGRGKALALRLAWFDGAAGRWVAELERTGPLDTRFDDLIFRALDDLLDSVQAAMPSEPEDVPAADSATVPADAAIASTAIEPSENAAAAPAPLPATSLDGPAALEESASPASAQEPLAAGAEGARNGPRGLELGFGAGPFLAGGSLGDFFELAGGLDARIAWYFPGREASFGLGLYAAGQAFTARGPLESAVGVLAPLALELRLAIAGGSFRPLARLSCGAALLYLRTELYDDRYAALPFASAGLGLARIFGSGLGLTLDLSYMAVLDGKDLIMGFNPTIGIAIPAGRR